MPKPPRWLLSRLTVAGIILVVVAVLIGLGRYWVPRWWAEATGDTSNGHGTVYSVADGDTLTVLSGGEKVTIRLLGIDAPEISHFGNPAGCGGPEAKTAAQSMMPKGTDVSWTTDPISDQVDVYGRVLAYVATSTVADVGLAMIDQGRAEAWVPKGEPYPTRWGGYTKAQKTAQGAGVGSWAFCGGLGR